MMLDGTNGAPLKVEGGVDERGLARLDVTYLALDLTAAWSVAPWEYEGLRRTAMKMSAQPGGGYFVVGSYEGNAPGGGGVGAGAADDEALATYELDMSQAQKPIEVHPQIDALKKKFGWGELDGGGYGFPKTVPKAAGGKATVGESREGVSPLYGVSEWLDVGAVWRKSWVAADPTIPVELFRNLGRISDPEGPVPTVGQGRNWLKSGVRVRGRGKAWECSLEWTLSGRGGWEPEIYKGQK